MQGVLPEGLSYIDINFFTHFPFSAGSPIARKADLSAAAIQEVPFFQFYIQFLKDVQAAQPLKLTQKGNLNRKFIRQLYDHRILPNKYVDDGTIKLSKEEDWAPIHYSHVLTKMGGLIKNQKGKLTLTKKGEKLLTNIPSLYLNLLDTYTNKFNWSYFTFNPESVAQYGYTLLLYLLLKYGDEERPSSFYTMQYRFAFPQFITTFPHNEYLKPEPRFLSCVHNRFFGKFCNYFGLAIVREEQKENSYSFDYFVRKSPLLDQIFSIVDYDKV